MKYSNSPVVPESCYTTSANSDEVRITLDLEACKRHSQFPTLFDSASEFNAYTFGGTKEHPTIAILWLKWDSLRLAISICPRNIPEKSSLT